MRLLAGVVRAADERTGLDVAEAQPLAKRPNLIELVRVIVALDQQVLVVRPEVLAHGEEVAVVLPQVAHRLLDLCQRLTEPDHNSRFRRHRRVELLHAADQLERAWVARLRPRACVEPRDGLDVVVEHDRSGADHGLKRLPVALEVGDQDFDLARRRAMPDRAYAGGEDAGAAVREVVPVHGGDDGVVEAERFDCARQPQRLEQVETVGAAGSDGAEAAGARADVTEDHECRGARVEALADVRAARLLANGVELLLAHDALDLQVAAPSRKAHLQRNWSTYGHRQEGMLLAAKSILADFFTPQAVELVVLRVP
jgi:hypothetical protein